MRTGTTWRWLVVAALLALTPAGAGARWQDPQAAGEEIYIAPDEAFSVPIPTGWTVEEGDGLVVLTGPGDGLHASVVVVQDPDPDAAIAAAMATAEPDYALPASPDRQEPPAPPGIDALVVVTYDGGQRGEEIVQAVARVVGGATYVVVYRGPLQEVIDRQSQLGIIDSGLLIAAVEVLDLSEKAPAPFDAAVRAELEAYVDRLLGDYGIPGASLVIVQGGDVVFSGGFGVTGAGGAPVDAETRMMIGSATKSMTTMLAATLVDDGTITWDTPVVDVLPYFRVADPELSREITIRNLFCACSGVPRRDLEFIFNANELTPEALVRSLADFHVATGFGEVFQYSNQMVAAGGYAVAAASDPGAELLGAYEAALRERVFDPIGMPRTTLDFDAVAAEGNYATPHGQTLQATYAPIALKDEATLEAVAPAGAVWSTADDLGRYLLTELGEGIAPGGERVVSAENLAETWEPQVAIDARSSYGLGWILSDQSGVAEISHDGNTLGFTSELAFLPEVDLGVGILANAQAANGFTAAVENRLWELLYGQPEAYDEVVRYELAQVDPGANPGADLPADQAAALVGEYASETLGDASIALDAEGVPVVDVGEFRTRVRLTAPQDGVVVTWDPPFAGGVLGLDGEDLVLTLGPESYRFARVAAAGTPATSPVASPVASPAASPVATPAA